MQTTITRSQRISGQTFDSPAGPLTIIECDYHRNGVSGAGFTAITFYWDDEDRPKQPRRKMVGIVFSPNEVGHGLGSMVDTIAVLDADLVAEGCVSFGINSWRGADHFGPGLLAALEAHDAIRDAELGL